MKTNKNKEGPQQNKKKESLEERVHRHLQDINSEISDEDIRDVKTEMEIREETNPESAGENEEQSGTNSNPAVKKEGEKKQTTPWNLLSDGFDSDM